MTDSQLEDVHKWKNRKHLVLDVDETLGHAFIGESCLQELKNSGIYDVPDYLEHRDRIRIIQVKDPGPGYTGSGHDLDMWFVKRPGLDKFLKFAFEYFDTVGIWSAGVENYVQDICSEVFVPYRGIPKPNYVWARKHCDGVVSPANDSERPLSKPLSKLFKEHPGLNMSLANTLLLDDKAANVIANPYNGVINPRFEPEPTVDSMTAEEEILHKFMAWLNRPEVKNVDDIRTITKSNIFNKSLVELIAAD